MRSRFGRWILAVAMVLGVAAAANADHIRVMVVQQDPALTGNTIRLRVDYNYSGNCCGGVFHWTTGETTTPRDGYLNDGISGGVYQGDASGTGTFSSGSTLPPALQSFTWNRFRPNPALMLVRIEITYTYAAPGTYSVAWDDCCPQSNGGLALVAVSGQAAPTSRILTFTQTTGTAWTDALQQGGILPCGAGTPVCYDAVNPTTAFATFTSGSQVQAYLQRYKVLFVGHNADTPTLTALNGLFVVPGISSWAQNDRGGIVVYAQSAANGFSWLPNLGGTGVATAPPGAGNTQWVDLTIPGLLHSSHRNQTGSVGTTPSSLANWTPSLQHAFTTWPSYLGTSAASALSTDAALQAVSLAGDVGQNPPAFRGCAFITGQPIEERALAGVLAAQQMVRSTVNYAISCDPNRLGV